MAIKQAKIFTITSCKGGVGKTVFTLGLAGLLERKGYHILIIDLDLYASGISLALNVENEKDIYKLTQDIKNNRYEAFEDYTVMYDDYIDVLSAPKDPRLANKIDMKYVDLILDKARTRYDVIIIDTNHLLSDINLVTFDYSDNILYLLTDDLIDLKNMRTMISIYNDMEKNNYTVILNRALGKKGKFSEYEIKNMIDSTVDCVLKDDLYISNMNEYILNGRIYTLDKRIQKKSSKTISKLENMLENLIERE